MDNIDYNPLYFFDKPIREKPLIRSESDPEIKKGDALQIQKPKLKVVLFEKYRPKNFNEIVGQEKPINTIKRNLDNLPHMILEGNAGVGKTTVVKVLCKELDANLLELNSSNERGIDIIRGKVMDFIRHLSLNNGLKIVFFDEADSMTPDAQFSLRTIIEKYSHSTRFIFACNDISKIIEPLKSRCKVFHFDNIKPEDMKKRLLEIINLENITINDNDLNKIIEDSNGDFRKAINDLQTI